MIDLSKFRLDLRSFVPSYSEFLKQGLDEDYFNETKSECSIEPKNASQTSDENDSILSLINNYDVSNINIASISFWNEFINDDHFIRFGSYEQDELAIVKNSGEVVLLEYGISHIMAYAAKNQDSFLESLLLIAKFSLNNMLLDFDEIDALSCENALASSSVAGGIKYLNFHKTVLGCFE